SPPIPTQLTLGLPAYAEVGQNVTISSALTDSNKQPISGLHIYYVEQQPLGTMLLGGGKTDSNGSTTINFEFTQTGNHQIQVIFSGSSSYYPNSIYSGSSESKIITITNRHTV
ncbi:MAG: Ig-like domain repeat protein, partial [Alphaproteobacteria bacterium]